ncbi:MAG: hypothetical protein IB617_02600 [Candidatus Nealsonbacteria bacterium]|nr:MAG: hypothetical protein IB617_02600 [Candidatus Nealsonbacteria bacterium]
MTELTKLIKEEAKERGETVRTYPLVYGGASVESKMYIFFKNGTITRSAIWNRIHRKLTYYDFEDTIKQIQWYQKILDRIKNIDLK